MLKQVNKGYADEAYASNVDFVKLSLLKCVSEVEISDMDTRLVELFFGGRYYPQSRNFFIDDPLLVVKRKFKFEHIDLLDYFFDSVICYLNKKYNFDILTSVLLKPKDIQEGKYNRFTTLNLSKCNQKGLYMEDTLEGKKGCYWKKYFGH
ncbi:hypothetical protein [Amedibacterium intestinale]|jgi:putative competence protein|uniref:hypothetical protein n=1 Tax=Amedibacterium intestinale TaxID=2583452 RepID=UPI001300B6A6